MLEILWRPQDAILEFRDVPYNEGFRDTKSGNVFIKVRVTEVGVPYDAAYDILAGRVKVFDGSGYLELVDITMTVKCAEPD